MQIKLKGQYIGSNDYQIDGKEIVTHSFLFPDLGTQPITVRVPSDIKTLPQKYQMLDFNLDLALVGKNLKLHLV